MDRASASEAGNVGSTPAGRKFKTPLGAGFLFGAGAGKLLCPRREVGLARRLSCPCAESGFLNMPLLLSAAFADGQRPTKKQGKNK